MEVRSMKQRTLVVVAVLAASLIGASVAAQGDEDRRLIRGGGTTMLESGSGAPDFVPVLTKLAFNWDGIRGDLECLALAPSEPAGDPGSGDFDTNVMYVTGPITSGAIEGGRAVLRGKATVTGLGAGEDVPFTLIVQRGGPGSSVVLRVSGLVFREIVLEGSISF